MVKNSLRKIDLGAHFNEKDSKRFYLNRTDDRCRDHRHTRSDCDSAVSELRNRLGGEYHVTSTIIPLSLFRTRRSITNSVVKQEGARIVILPDIEDAVSDILIHQLVLSAAVPVCVLR